MIRDPHTAKLRAKGQFDVWARTYDRSLLNHFLFRPSYDAVLEEIARWHAARGGPFDLLDVGCGTGTLVGMITSSNLPARHVVALDYANEMCRRAHRKLAALDSGRSVQLVNADSEHLPFAGGSFDIITCLNSFHHYPHQLAVVREMRRLVRPGGRLMIIDGFRDNVLGWVVFDVIITAIEKSVYHAPWSTMRRYFETAGFQDIYHRKFNFFFPVLVTVGTA